MTTETRSEGDSNTVTVDIVAVAAVPLTLLKVATTPPTLDEPGGTFEFALAITNGSAGGYRVDRFDHGRPGRSRDDLLRCRSESDRATL